MKKIWISGALCVTILLNVILLLPILVKYVFFILVSHINIISFISVSDIRIPSERKFFFVFIKNTPIIHKIYPEIRYPNRLLGRFENVKCFFDLSKYYFFHFVYS